MLSALNGRLRTLPSELRWGTNAGSKGPDVEGGGRPVTRRRGHKEERFSTYRPRCARPTGAGTVVAVAVIVAVWLPWAVSGAGCGSGFSTPMWIIGG